METRTTVEEAYHAPVILGRKAPSILASRALSITVVVIAFAVNAAAILLFPLLLEIELSLFAATGIVTACWHLQTKKNKRQRSMSFKLLNATLLGGVAAVAFVLVIVVTDSDINLIMLENCSIALAIYYGLFNLHLWMA